MKRSAPQGALDSEDSADDDYVCGNNSSEYSDSEESDLSDNISDELDRTNNDQMSNKPQKSLRTRKPGKESAKRGGNPKRRRTRKPSAEQRIVDESTDDEGSRKEALWAGFLKDTKLTANISTKLDNKIEQSTNGEIATTKSSAETYTSSKISCTNDKNKAHTKSIGTYVDDFPTNEVNVKMTDTSKIIGMKIPAPSPSDGMGSSRGVTTVLNQIGKKKKRSVLEETQLDWEFFKREEGIAEELQTFNRGRDGFLGRQDFLQRTDQKQFEIEKKLRHSRRKH